MGLSPTGSSGGITNSAGANVVPKSNGTNLVASSITDNGTTISTPEPIVQTLGSDVVGLKINPAGGQTADLMQVTSDGTNVRFRLDNAGRIGSRGARFGNGGESATLTFDQVDFGNTLTIFAGGSASTIRGASNAVYGWNSSPDSPNGSVIDTGISRGAAKVVAVGNGTAGDASGGILTGRVVTAKATDYPVVAADSNTFFTNTGAGAGVTFTLPTPVVGMTYEFYRDANQTVTIDVGGAVVIRVGASASTGGGNVTLDAVGSRIRLVAISTTLWVGDLTGSATFN